MYTFLALHDKKSSIDDDTIVIAKVSNCTLTNRIICVITMEL